jgi:hypothetical protein
MRLWSVVATQLRKPVVFDGRRPEAAPCRRRRAGHQVLLRFRWISAARAGTRSTRPARRHVRFRFGIPMPFTSYCIGFIEFGSASHARRFSGVRSWIAPANSRRLIRCVRSGPWPAAQPVALPHLVAGRTGLTRTEVTEELAAACLERALRGDRRRTLLRRDPRLEVGRCHRLDARTHVHVAQPAVLGALPDVATRLVGLQVQVRGVARHEVLLAGQARDPERVDDTEVGRTARGRSRSSRGGRARRPGSPSRSRCRCRSRGSSTRTTSGAR